MADRLLAPPLEELPGSGPIRLRVRVPSGRTFGVRGAELYERLDTTWTVRGSLATTAGLVEVKEADNQQRLLLRDSVQSYAYVYATETLAVLQTLARIRVQWQYAPSALGPAVAFAVYRQVGEGTAFAKIAEIAPVEPGPQTYRYFDTDILPGLTYGYYVIALTAMGEESLPTTTVTATVPRSLQAPQNMAATFVAAS